MIWVTMSLLLLSIKDKYGETALDLVSPSDTQLRSAFRKTQAQASVSKDDIADGESAWNSLTPHTTISDLPHFPKMTTTTNQDLAPRKTKSMNHSRVEDCKSHPLYNPY